MNSLVSIIVPSYNKDKYIKETIDSVIKQTYTNWELIVIDDVSNDSTVSIVHEFQKKDSRILLYENIENKGANYSRNFGVNKANGKYIVFLDADDLLRVDCLEQRLKIIENSSYDFCVFTMGVFINKIGDSSYQWIPNSNDPLIDFLQHKLPWAILQPIWKKEFLIKTGIFDLTFQRLQDVEFHTRALLTNDVTYKQVITEPDCFFRIDEQRKNFKQAVFLDKWMNSSFQYYNKFYNQLPDRKMNRYLLGTIYKTYLQLFYSYKSKTITKSEFDSLNKVFVNWIYRQKLGFKNNLCFKLSNFFNLCPIKLPGINFIIIKLLIH